jgi:hypothetical protein
MTKPFFLLLTCVSSVASSAVTTTWNIHDDAVQASTSIAVAAWRQQLLHIRRQLQQGETTDNTNTECIAETLALYENNPRLQQAWEAVIEEQDAALASCPNRRNCEIDDANFVSTPTFVGECEKLVALFMNLIWS